jgi:23S rRNA pseudouridine2604 synthase
MCEYLGYEVTHLKRVRIMNVQLNIPEGEWRDLTLDELQTINDMVSKSETAINSSSNLPANKPSGLAESRPHQNPSNSSDSKHFKRNNP